MLDKLKKASKKTIGTKQTLKAIEKDQVCMVFIAEDAEEHVVSELKRICKEKGIEVIAVNTMKELGDACGIQVGAASAAILNS
ncbi:MAG: 50S ribosomal protein L7Ae-like protein [Tepidanaerobacter acetatoxydans]|jgi:large subunit ribosomal protein L7A|uniref:L7Ae/L30e/S12e/Gadd45 family ribosomal protein n=1 Tax=Tepidanaerobacter TaxID=499228 RepID=UPI000A8ACDDF|nr:MULTISPECIES: ribosomal L7Ae/L30e/S12e/Gadd45 family protein [Tepidanaerobacter]NLU10821.1 50S ribosomal protein L7Ae-like protein [Tepidanaerobacter acetatoxydans]